MSTAPIAVSQVPQRGRLLNPLDPAPLGVDDIAYAVTFLSACLVIVITALLVFELVKNSAEARHVFGWKFLTTQTWDPVAPKLGALAFVYGTLITSILALVIGIPLGVGAAIFLQA